MKKLLYFIFLLIQSQGVIFSQQETRPFILNKSEFTYLDENNQLVSEAIENAFGDAKNNGNYKIDIVQVDVSNIKIKEFRYFPNASVENKNILKSKVAAYHDNYYLAFKVKINPKSSTLNEKIKGYLDKKNCLVLNVTIIGDPKIFVIEIKSVDKLNELLKDKSFVSKAFKKHFGDEQKNNYQIKYEQVYTCIKHDIFDKKCEMEYEIEQSTTNYDKFEKSISSQEFKGAYVIYTVPIIRKKSKLISTIEDCIIKDEDGSEKLKFYLCLPGEQLVKKENKLAPIATFNDVDKPTNIGSIKGRMLAVDTKTNPIKNETVELRNLDQSIVKSQKTDENGNFEFNSVNLENAYMINLVNYDFDQKTTKIYIANLKNDLIKELTKDKDGKFSYKTIDADIYRLTTMNEEDIELAFSIQKKHKKSSIVIQDYVYYELNSFQISIESLKTIDNIIKLLQENQNYNLEIISHTDSRGDASENLKLSQKRSESVLAYITKNGQIDPKKIKAIGLGETKPINSCSETVNCLESEYKMNRRTEFLFTLH